MESPVQLPETLELGGIHLSSFEWEGCAMEVPIYLLLTTKSTYEVDQI